MIPLISHSLVIAGALILVGALVPVRRLMARLRRGPVRSRWYAMTALIVVFIAGYLAYAVAFWNQHAALVDVIVPVVFFLGACFVWLAAILSLQTTIDVMRLSVLEREASTDALTGVLNRRSLDRRLSEEIARARRYDVPLSILLLDIDHFKQINDKFGHQTGDRVLVTAAKLLAKVIRESDVLARYGGEEFLILTPHTPLSGSVKLAERLRERIEAHDFDLTDKETGAKITVTTSVGVASLSKEVDDIRRLVLTADMNLYRAKREGRNRIVADPPAALLSQRPEKHGAADQAGTLGDASLEA